MCGIFGMIYGRGVSPEPSLLKKTTDRLFTLSESRGKEASGLAIKQPGSIDIYKEPVPASSLMKSRAYRDLYKLYRGAGGEVAVIGHSRLVTDGAEDINANNQPVVKDGICGIHNGIIVNVKDLWQRFPAIHRTSEVDTEVLLSLFRYFYKLEDSICRAVCDTFAHIQGSASIALLFEDFNRLLLATNTGSLYTSGDKEKKSLVFASERHILEQFFKKNDVCAPFNSQNISQLKPKTALMIDLSSLETYTIDMEKCTIPDACQEITPLAQPLEIVDRSPAPPPVNTIISGQYIINGQSRQAMMDAWEDVYKKTSIKRCANCILPETMPFIHFDQDGVCNFCGTQKPFKVHGPEALEQLVAPHRRKDGSQDIIVPISGGRDSTYALHYIKKVLEMNPIAYTYDWGVLTDLGRRNQARICGELGVEHIIISADIRKKREYVRKNLLAWLKKPELGMVPLLMAGDKQLLYYCNYMRKITGIPLLTLAGASILENSLFKIGFAGIRSKSALVPHLHISARDKLDVMFYYVKNYLTNPAYFNRSLYDSLHAFYSYFMALKPDDYILFYDYIEWDEKTVLDTIIQEYDWEIEQDTKATWRIDDGTTPFYNYIYLASAGFNENDTFRSSQVRQGMISREEAMKLTMEENKPRFDSIQWYARTIEFDINRAIGIINRMPKLYKK